MDFLEVVFVLPRRDYCFFHGTIGSCLFYGRTVLRPCIFNDCVYDCTETDIRRPYFGLAFFGMYYSALQRRTIVLPWNSGAVFVQDLYGSEKKADLSGEGRTVGKRPPRQSGNDSLLGEALPQNVKG